MFVERKKWEVPTAEDAGNVAELVRNGEGKTVVLDGDSGEPNKNTQQDGGG
jgi:hypothetical protein